MNKQQIQLNERERYEEIQEGRREKNKGMQRKHNWSFLTYTIHTSSYSFFLTLLSLFLLFCSLFYSSNNLSSFKKMAQNEAPNKNEPLDF
jgi:hypothetical protein